MDLFRQLLVWLMENGSDQVETRFRYFFKALENQPEWEKGLSTSLNQVLRDCRSFRLFTEVGVKIEHGLWGDIAGRLLAKILTPASRHDSAQIFSESFVTPDAREALDSLSPAAVEKICEWFQKNLGHENKEKLVVERKEAMYLLAAHVAHYGLSAPVQRRVARPNEVSTSPYFLLVESIRELDSVRGLEVLDLCQKEIESVYDHLDQSGVSVDVVNRLETIEALLQRLKILLELQTPQPDVVHRFLREVVKAQESSRSVFNYLARHFYLLSRKVVERNGHSGEHYIAHTKAELRSMFWSALGGGCIVVLMTIFKVLFIHTHPAPVFLGLGVWIIYSAGFLAMQFSGTTLATKIPSFTASRLAGFLKSRHFDQSGFTNEVKSTLKSQVLALIGNLCGVIPFALVIDQALRYGFGGGLMDVAYADHVIDNLHPIFSLAVLLGALTGFQLWLSSLVGGWFENWVVYNRIPETVAEHYRLRQVLGEASAVKFSNWILDQSSGLATNVSLGFLFGFCPVIGDLFGLNFNGNHVTISTASSLFAFSALNFQVDGWTVAATSTGLLLIGLMNFVVSFLLALFVAARARRMQFWRMLHYLRQSFGRRGA